MPKQYTVWVPSHPNKAQGSRFWFLPVPIRLRVHGFVLDKAQGSRFFLLPAQIRLRVHGFDSFQPRQGEGYTDLGPSSIDKPQGTRFWRLQAQIRISVNCFGSWSYLKQDQAWPGTARHGHALDFGL